MEFKNKADKMGFYFGKFCVYFGGLLTMISIFLMAHDGEEPPMDYQFILSMFLGFMIYKYGDYRTGGRWNDN
jgi:hypothetical protein